MNFEFSVVPKAFSFFPTLVIDLDSSEGDYSIYLIWIFFGIRYSMNPTKLNKIIIILIYVVLILLCIKGILLLF